jgi:GxxExxY protein
MIDREQERITEAIIGAAIEVHRQLGPGLLESAYEACLYREITQRGLNVTRQVGLPVEYKGAKVDCGYRLDLVVEGEVVVELKAVESLLPIHNAQLITYLKLSGYPIGLLINFNVTMLRNGLRRLVNNHHRPPME